MTPTFTERSAGTTRWLAVADDLAATLADDVVRRDAAGSAPAAEIALLKESGLLDLLVPEERGLPGGERHARRGGEQRSGALGDDLLDGRRDLLARGTVHPPGLERVDPPVEDLHTVAGETHRVSEIYLVPT
jgi:hypothetical protein